MRLALKVDVDTYDGMRDGVPNLLRFFSDLKIKGLNLKIIPVRNWQRYQLAGTDNFNFVPTSPAIKNSSTALLYPGMGLLEGINVNEGRGTDKPFVQFGAPWINAEELKQVLDEKQLPGINFKSCSYTPADGLYKNESCNGLELTVINKEKFHPVAMGITLVSTILKLYPLHVKARLYITNANPSGSGHLDKLLGIKNALGLLKDGHTLQTDVSQTWPQKITPYLLYD